MNELNSAILGRINLDCLICFTMLPPLKSSTQDQTTVYQRRLTRSQVTQFLKWSSCVCTITGGVALASNTAISPYGFLMLAMGSSQMVGATFLMRDRGLFAYSLGVFLFVDCLGIYRWLVTGK
ncbi:MAG: hypothetical protein RLZZ511_965 [Cyanobacteriota bacterium]